MASRSCAIRIFAVECGVRIFFLSNLWKYIVTSHILLKTTFFELNFCRYTVWDITSTTVT